MRSLREIKILQNIPVIVRAALNEPVENGVVADSFRLGRALPTIQYLQSKGARVVVLSHIDPPAGQVAQGTETLAPIAAKLATMLRNCSFSPDTIGPKAREAVRAMRPGDVLVMENLRRNRGEAMNDLDFAKELAALGDVFVEDSFDTCHRKHASIVSLPNLLPSYAGLELESEVLELNTALKPASPSLAVIGGAKFSTKEPVIMALLDRYDKVFVGGALANDFIKAQGRVVGASLVSGADEVKLRNLLGHPRLVLPIDARVGKKAAAAADARVSGFGDIAPDEIIFDAGPATEALLTGLAASSKQILWNGPLGAYESGYIQATDALAQAIASSSAHSLIGGGDTITAIEALNILDKFSFVSIGGGAMLDYLAAGTLPGIAALN